MGTSRLFKHVGNIYDQRRTNHRLTVLLVAAFMLYYLVLGYGTDVFVLKNDPLGIVFPESRGIPYATVISCLLSGAYALYCFFRGEELILKSVKIDRVWWSSDIPDGKIMKRVWHDDQTYRQLINVIHEMSVAAGIPMPSVYLVYDPDPNAFSTGKNPQHASVAVTKGLLDKLDREELQAVVAHEVGHIRNHDVRLMTLLATLAGGSILLSAYAQARWIEEASFFRRIFLAGRITLFFAFWAGMVVFTPLVSRALTLMVAQGREYQADVVAAQLTRNPAGVAKALEKLDFFAGPTWSISPAIAHLCTVSPMGKHMQMERQSLVDRLYFKTHPPMSKRIAAVKELGFLQGRRPAQDDKAEEKPFA